jgi:threonyl-tRNA synthetase
VSKAVEDAEEVDASRREGRFSNALVAFVTVERGDESSTETLVDKAAEDLASIAERVRADTIVIYPYAHLSPNLAPPHAALRVLERLEDAVRSKASGKSVVRAPFGWYKEFELHCYGHPLAELSRTFTPETTVPRKVRKEFVVLTPDGEVYDPADYLSRADPELARLIEKEALGKELGEIETPVTRLCSKFGFEWEPLSDYGHMRYQPHAAFMVDAVSEYSWIVAKKLGIPVLRVRGTNMFDLAARPVYEHAELYGDRLYELTSDRRRVVLRYAACHQQFAMLRDYVLSYRDLPLGMFEVADSYRLEQSGEVSLCFRLRKFIMPDLHILTKDIDEAMKISAKLQKLIHDEAGKLGRRYVAVYNVTRDFWEEEREKVVELVRRDGRPALITIYPPGMYYWVVNVEYHIIDSAGRPREIATYQFDVGNARRFGIRYVDERGSERYPVIIHTAIIGSVERYIYMVFDTAVQSEKRGETPSIPTWLSPIQVRIIPLDPTIGSPHREMAEKVASILEENLIRVDVDDRRESLGKRVRDAAREWIPYIVVIGDREVKTGTLNVTIRRTNDRLSMKPEELVARILAEVKGYPRLPSYLPRYVSQRPSLTYLEKPVVLSTAEGYSSH